MLVSKHAGFTIVEILVSIMILSIGILGMASLQAVTIRNSHSAYLRSQATMLAYDISERMRANRMTAQANGYDLVGAQEDSDCVDTNLDAGGCTAAEMAQHDIFEWNNAIANTLPNGQGAVCYDTGDTSEDGANLANPSCSGDAGAGVYSIKIWWDDNRSGTLTRFTTNFHP